MKKLSDAQYKVLLEFDESFRFLEDYHQGTVHSLARRELISLKNRFVEIAKITDLGKKVLAEEKKRRGNNG